MKINKEDYAAKIASATPLELVIINYDLIIDSINRALEEKPGTAAFEGHIEKAKAFLLEMMKSLNMEYDISAELLSVYIHVNGLLIKSFFSGSAEPLTEAKEHISILRDSYRQLKYLDNDKPVMENTQPVYAGLTYKNGKLTEYVHEDVSRGFKA